MRNFITGLLTLLMSVPLAAQTTSVVTENVPYSGSMYYFHQRKVARTTTGLLMVAWAVGTSAGSQVMYSTYDPDFQSGRQSSERRMNAPNSVKNEFCHSATIIT